MMSRALKSSWLIVILVACLTACGGGSTTPGSGAIGGITGTGVFVAFGTVTGIGSVIVNGVEYDTSAATFTIDGNLGSQDDLSVGDVVLVKGTIDDDNTNAVASSVEFDDNVEGPIAAESIGVNSFVVLGQTVIVDDVETSFDDDINPPSLAGLADGDIVEVTGLVMNGGAIAATRIERKIPAPGDQFEVTGVVSEPVTATTFKITDLVVDFVALSATFDNFPGGRSVMAGDPVEVKGDTTLGPAGELRATRVEFKGERLAGDEGDHGEIEGFITRFGSDEDFDIGEVTVMTIPGETEFEGGDASDLGMNVKVEVEGEYDASDVLVATKVQIKLGKAVRITALVDDVVLPDDLVLLGITIETESLVTRFEDKTNVVREDFGIDDINRSVDYVEVRGHEIPHADGSGLGSGIVFAAILERDDPDTETIIQGFVQSVSDPDFMILGVKVKTDGNTKFREETSGSVNDITAADFFGTNRTGSLIKAKGTTVTAGPPVNLLAEEVEIQLE